MNIDQLATVHGCDPEDIRGVKTLMNRQGIYWPNGEIDLDRFNRWIAARPKFRLHGASAYAQPDGPCYSVKELTRPEFGLECGETKLRAVKRAMEQSGVPWHNHMQHPEVVRAFMVEHPGVCESQVYRRRKRHPE